MERVCFIFELMEAAEERYDRAHAVIWPEMLALLAEAGISDYSIFRAGIRLYAFLKAEPSWEAAQAVLRGLDVQRRWNAGMAPLIAWQLDDDGRFREAVEVFRFDGRD